MSTLILVIGIVDSCTVYYERLKEGYKEAPVKDFVTMEIPIELQKQVES